MAFQEHKASQDGDGNLAAPVDDADAGIDGACDPVRFFRGIGQFYGGPFDLSQTFLLPVKGLYQHTSAIGFLDEAVEPSSAVLTPAGIAQGLPGGSPGRQQRNRRKHQENGGEKPVKGSHDDQRANDGAYSHKQAQKAGLKGLGHFFQIIGGPAHDGSRLLAVKEGERQAV